MSAAANSRDYGTQARLGATLKSQALPRDISSLAAEPAGASTEHAASAPDPETPPVRSPSSQVETALQSGETVRFDGVLFEYDKATLKVSASVEIAALADALKAQPNLRVRVEGHTDDVGGSQYNLKLSLRRAEAVVAALVARGVPQANLSPVGFGLTRPFVSNATEGGRALNRRVDIVPVE